LLLIPAAARSRMPSDLQQRAGDAPGCQILSVAGLTETTKQILSFFESGPFGETGPDDSSASATATAPATPAAIDVDDFFALGYAALQIQVMTRRLRYSSNLDQVTFSEHAVAAARSWVAGDQAACQEALQAAFDLLGEERDHYFSGDPHLIDLVLVAPSTVGPALEETLAGDAPLNLLLSAEAAERIAEDHPQIAKRIGERIAAGNLCLAGGAPDDDQSLDLMGSAAVRPWLSEGLQRTAAALGSQPPVFGRIGGGIPGDLVSWLVPAQLTGAITNDFASGVGAQVEAKMIWQAASAELDALTAGPLPATQPQSFLALGAKLGEAIDSGQVGAGLLVRWPGESSPWLRALRKASRFTPALGHFWKLDEFFSKGERPYHACTIPAARGDGLALQRDVDAERSNPLTSVANRFLSALRAEVVGGTRTLTSLLNGQPNAATADAQRADDPTSTGGEHWPHVAHAWAAALGMRVADLPQSEQGHPESLSANSAAVLNPHCGAARVQVELAGPPPAAKTPGLFAANAAGRHCRVTIDVPGPGFASLTVGDDRGESSKGVKGLLQRLKPDRPLAQGQAFSNEFLDVAIHPETGAVAAVHAGEQRGNRFSWQLAYFDREAPGDGYSEMVCDRLRVLTADQARGVIQAEGRLRMADRNIAQYAIRYTVERGSRWLDIEIELDTPAKFAAAPWHNYLAGRAAWADSALSVRPLVRDKRHRTSGRRLESPLGVEVDEGDRKLLVCGYGLPAHRRIGGERLDTLLLVRGETARKFRLAYGFDVPEPVRSLRHKLVPPAVVPLRQLDGDPARGWLLDVEPKRVIATGLTGGGSQPLRLTLIETSGQSCRARVQCFQDIAAAERIHDGEPLEIDQGAALVHLAGHEVMEIEVRFA
jgi:alpha-mannosidase